MKDSGVSALSLRDFQRGTLEETWFNGVFSERYSKLLRMIRNSCISMFALDCNTAGWDSEPALMHLEVE